MTVDDVVVNYRENICAITNKRVNKTMLLFHRTSVSLSADGRTVAIGAINNDGINGGSSGHVRVYIWNGSAWVQLGSDIDGETNSERIGNSVSLSSDGHTMAVGSGDFSIVRVFRWNGVNWVQLGIDIDGDGSGLFGKSVSLSDDGTSLAIGAPKAESAYSGHVRVFKFPTFTEAEVPSMAPSAPWTLFLIRFFVP